MSPQAGLLLCALLTLPRCQGVWPLLMRDNRNLQRDTALMTRSIWFFSASVWHVS